MWCKVQSLPLNPLDNHANAKLQILLQNLKYTFKPTIKYITFPWQHQCCRGSFLVHIESKKMLCFVLTTCVAKVLVIEVNLHRFIIQGIIGT